MTSERLLNILYLPKKLIPITYPKQMSGYARDDVVSQKTTAAENPLYVETAHAVTGTVCLMSLAPTTLHLCCRLL